MVKRIKTYILLPPPCCSNYVPGQAPMHPGRVVTTFVAADGICEMLMSTGVGQIVNYDNPTKVAIGGGLIKARVQKPNPLRAPLS